MTVSDLLLEVLKDYGARDLFGIPGDAINDVTDAIRRQDTLRFIQVRHEEAGAFAAASQAKLTGRLGVCMGTAGPGAVHLLNGLYDAKMDHAPVLAITGHVDTTFMGTDYHQEIDLYSLYADVAVFNQVVTTETQLPHIIAQACQKALTYNSVAHISLPQDIAGRKIPKRNQDRIPVITKVGTAVPHEDNLENAVELLDKAQRVTILAGLGCRNAKQELIRFADKINAPIVRTLRAKDIIADDHRLCAGGLGQLGNEPGLKAVQDCDLLVLAGTDFPYHDYLPEDTKAIQIDLEPTHIGRRYPVNVGLRGHAGPTLKLLTERVQPKSDLNFLEAVQKEVRAMRDKQRSVETSDDTPIRPQRLARSISELAADNAVFTCDTGAVTVWAARHLHLRANQRFTLSSALASMAFALPGAIGAQLLYPDRQVIALCGDGGFSMLMGDFITAVKYQLPIKVIIFNNGKLGLIKMEQEAAGMPEYATGLLNPDFAAFARACGAEGFHIEEPEQIRSTLQSAYQTEGPCIVDVAVDPDEITMPPQVGARDAFNYGLAKVKEFING